MFTYSESPFFLEIIKNQPDNYDEKYVGTNFWKFSPALGQPASFRPSIQGSVLRQIQEPVKSSKRVTSATIPEIMPVRYHSIIIICVFFLIIITGCTGDHELNWIQEDGYKWAELNPGFLGTPGFELQSPSTTGIDFRNEISDEIIRENRHYANGSGVAVGDVTGDGLPDIYFASLVGANKLYKNLGGFQFEEITEQAGVAHEDFNSTGVALIDVNGNGHLDLLITSLTDGNSLYINDGTGKFELKQDSGLGESRGAHSIAAADINGNGLLDLYITNYRLKSVRDIYGPADLSMENTVTENEDGSLSVLPEFRKYYEIIETGGDESRHESGEYDELYINAGEGRFKKADLKEYFPVNVNNEAGLLRDWGLTATFRDVTGNGQPDLFVANDFWTPDRLWINRGDGIFEAADPLAIRNQSYSSMGVDFSDLNRDGKTDFVVTEMLSDQHEHRLRQYSDYLPVYQGSTHNNRNSVYLNRGDTTFAQIAHFSGLEATGWSWATNFMDIDLDGYEDLIVATGFYRDYLDMDAQREINRRYQEMGEEIMERGEFLQFPVLNLNNKIFRNNGDLTFSDKSLDWGFDIADISMGMATGDLNNDGTPDLVINRFNEEAVIYENRSNKSRIAVRLKGLSPNTKGTGAKIELVGGPVKQSKEIIAGGNYLSHSQQQVVFAADENQENHTILVTWRNETQSRIENVKANRIYEIEESSASEINDKTRDESSSDTLFKDISENINHYHHESSYNDFQRVQPLLPKELSRRGPGAAWFDYNDNGLDDLVISTGKGGILSVFENLGNGKFSSRQFDDIEKPVPGDQTAIIGWRENGQSRFVIGSSNYEQGDAGVPSAFIYSSGSEGWVKSDSIPGTLSATGPVAAADYTGDDTIDLFIGGHFLPGGYPRDASSRLFINRNGEFVLDEENSGVLSGIGLVTSAVFADITQNSFQDLLIATEWGSIKLLENRDGRFHDITEEVGLNQWKGWWNGIATGDFTNNGLTDFVVANVGLNSPYKPKEHSLKLFYDDFNHNNRLDIVDAYYHEQKEAYVPRRKILDFRSVPVILQNMRSHQEFATASADKIFGRNFNEVPFKEINTVEHLLFINTGNGFEARPLPAEAQFSSGYSVAVADFDNDGNEDLFMSQNSFEFPSTITRLDAGRGIVLKGDGNGNFEPLSGSDSGIKIYGEQRSAALADIDLNGKTDLVVTQNGGQTKLFKNNSEQRGVRIILEGPDSNQMALGSSIRLVYENGTKGARRTIQAGSGYWSQNSSTQVLGMSSTPAFIEIRWPDGTQQQVAFEENQLDYVIRYDQ